MENRARRLSNYYVRTYPILKIPELHRLPVQHRQRAGQPQARRADVRIGLATVLVYAAAEGLGLRKQLDVNLKADDGLILGKNLRRERSGSGHGQLRFYQLHPWCSLLVP